MLGDAGLATEPLGLDWTGKGIALKDFAENSVGIASRRPDRHRKSDAWDESNAKAERGDARTSWAMAKH